MRNCLLLPLLFVLFNSTVCAQKEVTVQWGPEYQNSNKAYISKIIGEDSSGFYVLKKSKTNFIEKYSHTDLALLFSKPLVLPEMGKHEVQFEQLLYIDEQLLLFTSFWDKSTDLRTIYVQKIDAQGNLNAEMIPLDETRFERKKAFQPFRFIVSRKKTKFLIHFDNAFDKNENEQFRYKVFDGKLNLLWERHFELPNRDKLVRLSRIQLDESGNVYLLTAIAPDKKRGERYERKVQNETFSVLAYYSKEQDLRQFEIDLGKTKWIADVTYTINTEGNLLIGGFYSNESAGTMNGTFFLAIDRTTKDVISQNLKPFEREFMLNFMNEKQFQRERDLGVFNLSDIVLKEDGGAAFVAEYYAYYEVTTTGQNGVTRTTYHYLYHDVIIMSVDKAGEIDWISHFPKQQHTTNDNGFYSSYTLAIDNDKMQFIFNDNPKNIIQYEKNPAKLKTMSGAKKAIAMMVTVDTDGNTRRAPLFEAKDFKTILRPKLYFNSAQTGSTLIFGIKRKTYKFGRINFN
jgi:hypothetical protein